MFRKKSIIGAVLVVIIIFAVIGCTNQKSENAVNDAKINSTNQNEEEESFYGDWQIEKILAFASVGTYSEDDLNTIIGKKLTFSKESASCFGDEIAVLNNTAVNPTYDKSMIAKSDFESNYRITFDSLGIEGDSVTEIKAIDSEGNGCIFYQKDNNTLILYGGGVFLELSKI